MIRLRHYLNMKPTAEDLKRLNSITKYPSIPTFHAMGGRGVITPEVNFAGSSSERVIVTEKIDGTNARLITCPGGESYYMGSREELLTYRDDFVHNPAMGIVDALRVHAEEILARGGDWDDDGIVVFYFEVYGEPVKSKYMRSYTSTAVRASGARLFDVMRLDGRELESLMGLPTPEIARWRDGNGQPFMNETDLMHLADAHGISLVPRWTSMAPPATLEQAHAWLQREAQTTLASLDGGPVGSGGKPEGVVIRDSARTRICKLRFEDYERTLQNRPRML